MGNRELMGGRKIRIAYLVRPAEGGIKVHLLTLLSGLDRSKFEPKIGRASCRESV